MKQTIPETTTTDELKNQYNAVKRAQYAISYDAKFAALLSLNIGLSSVSGGVIFRLTREEVLAVLQLRREKLHEQLSSIQ